MPEASLEHAARLLDAEHASLAEHVAEARDALGLDGGQLLRDDGSDIGLRPGASRAVLGWHRVRTEEGRHDLDRSFAIEASHDIESRSSVGVSRP